MMRNKIVLGSARYISSAINSNLTGKCAVITGASRGIGAATALRYAQEGVQCILVGRNSKLLEQVKNQLNNVVPCGTAEHRILVGDVGKEDFWSQFKSEKNIDILVNAAGITHYSPLVVTSSALLHEVIQTNLLGTIMACRSIGKKMMAQRTGCIINIASLLGSKGGKGSTVYAASKAGVIGLTRSLSVELGVRNVRVNVILPGYIETDMTKAMTPEARQIAMDEIPLKRFGLGAEIADAAVFLAQNRYANNCTLNLDGGLSGT